MKNNNNNNKIGFGYLANLVDLKNDLQEIKNFKKDLSSINKKIDKLIDSNSVELSQGGESKPFYKDKILLTLLVLSILLIISIISIKSVIWYGVTSLILLLSIICIPFLWFISKDFKYDKYKHFLLYFPVFLFYLTIILYFSFGFIISASVSLYDMSIFIDFNLIKAYDFIEKYLMNFIYLFYSVLLGGIVSEIFSKTKNKVSQDEKNSFIIVILALLFIFGAFTGFNYFINSNYGQDGVKTIKECFQENEKITDYKIKIQKSNECKLDKE